MRPILTSMILPGGAVRIMTGRPVDPSFQKEAKEFRGGPQDIWAGTAVDTVVSLTSRGWDWLFTGNNTLQVAAAPWEAGGVQISTFRSLAD
jgi:hypothetical protein